VLRPVARLVVPSGVSSPARLPPARGENAPLAHFAVLEKKGEADAASLVWVDETGLYLLPSVVRTYAPRGQTPIRRAPLSHDPLSLIGGLTADGRLLTQVHDHAIRGPDVVRFLRHLLRHVAGPLVVLWDGASIHRSQPVKDFLRTPEAKRLHLEGLPAYAPDLNAAEGLWRLLKHDQLKNLICEALWELRFEVRLALTRLRHRRDAMLGCIAQVGCSL